MNGLKEGHENQHCFRSLHQSEMISSKSQKSEKERNENTTRELVENCRLLHECIQLLAIINEVNIDQYQYSTTIQEVSLTLASLEQCFITYLHVVLSSVSSDDYKEIDFSTRPETHQLIYLASLLQNGDFQIKMYGKGGFGGADSIIFYVKTVLKKIYGALEGYLKSFYPSLSDAILKKRANFNNIVKEQKQLSLTNENTSNNKCNVKNVNRNKFLLRREKMHKIIHKQIKRMRVPSFKRIVPVTIAILYLRYMRTKMLYRTKLRLSMPYSLILLESKSDFLDFPSWLIRNYIPSKLANGFERCRRLLGERNYMKRRSNISFFVAVLGTRFLISYAYHRFYKYRAIIRSLKVYTKQLDILSKLWTIMNSSIIYTQSRTTSHRSIMTTSRIPIIENNYYSQNEKKLDDGKTDTFQDKDQFLRKDIHSCHIQEEKINQGKIECDKKRARGQSLIRNHSHYTLIAPSFPEEIKNFSKFGGVRALIKYVPMSSEYAFWYDFDLIPYIFKRMMNLVYSSIGTVHIMYENSLERGSIMTEDFLNDTANYSWKKQFIRISYMVYYIPKLFHIFFYYSLRPAKAAQKACAITKRPSLATIQSCWRILDNPLTNKATRILGLILKIKYHNIHTIGGLKCIIYSLRKNPFKTDSISTDVIEEKVLNSILYIHGGGFATHMKICDIPIISMILEKNPDAILIVPLYTLLPKGVYPIPCDELFEMYKALFSSVNGLPNGFKIGKVALFGESAGGNLATSTLIRIIHYNQNIEKLGNSKDVSNQSQVDYKHENDNYLESRLASDYELKVLPGPVCVWLPYPVLNFSLAPSPSRAIHISDPVLPLGVIITLTKAYLNLNEEDFNSNILESEEIVPFPIHSNGDIKTNEENKRQLTPKVKYNPMDVYHSPSNVDDKTLIQFPPTLFHVGGFDPLCDDAIDLHTRLAKSGRMTKILVHRSLFHGFLGFIMIHGDVKKMVKDGSLFIKEYLE